MCCGGRGEETGLDGSYEVCSGIGADLGREGEEGGLGEESDEERRS